MRAASLAVVGTLLGTTLLGPNARAQDRPILLTGAKVFTGQGQFKTGLSILIQNGKIAKIGAKVDAPVNAIKHELKDQFVTPGLIDANTALGLDSPTVNEESSEVTPQIRIVDAIDPDAWSFKHALSDGVTTAYVSPGERNVFGGLGVIVKTAGASLKDRVVREDAMLRMTLGSMPSAGNSPMRVAAPNMYYRRPTNRMGTIWEIRKAFYDADKARGSRQKKEISAATQVLINALDRKIKVRTTARQDQDIRTALRLANEFGIDIILDEATEAYYAMDYIVAAKIPVIAAPPSVMTGHEGERPQTDTIALLANAGVPVCIQTGLGLGALPLVREAAFAVRGGMNRQAALASITSVPAKILGIDDRVGTLADGKDADLVVWTRNPLSPSSRAVAVFVDGKLRSGNLDE